MAEDVIKDISEYSEEDKAKAWEGYVRSEVNAALDMYFPRAITGNICIKYVPHLIEKTEAGDLVDNTKADAVGIFIVLDFEEPLDLNKPRIDDETESE